MKRLYCLICEKYKNLNSLLEITLLHSINCSKCKNEYEKLFKEEESIDILKTLRLIENIIYNIY